jgi:hypothetical protein
VFNKAKELIIRKTKKISGSSPAEIRTDYTFLTKIKLYIPKDDNEVLL